MKAMSLGMDAYGAAPVPVELGESEIKDAKNRCLDYAPVSSGLPFTGKCNGGDEQQWTLSD
ncbi:hypothetical protein [Nocardia sp. NPDC050175]|uniref:hypothetical protein n=1 Tax=Nocardia sp. NPDC050175 TaxID=3364317 RepID=UPI0037A96FF7